MALITEDGTGKADAESFCSVAVADAYHLSIGTPAVEWADKTEDPDKENHLRKATKKIINDNRGLWKGTSVTRDQALPYPRTGVVNEENWALDSNIVPIELQHATAELAHRSFSEEITPDIKKPGKIRKKMIGAGQAAVESETEYAGAGQSQIKEYRKVSLLLAGLLEPSGGVRLVRV